MSDNVIILGAGASADAGIPLMGEFMDVMWTIARYGQRNQGKASKQDLAVIEEALKVRKELDSYHGRAAFDVWNIEDILSILSFSSRKRLEWMTKAIARVIELTCNVKHDGKLNVHPETITMYMNFWRALINWAQARNVSVPPILTFNYDLVLERSLLHALVGKYYRTTNDFKHDGIEVAYSSSVCENVRLKSITGHWRNPDYTQVPGLMVEEFGATTNFESLKLFKFELLKLHGSVNFPRPRRGRPTEGTNSQRLINPLDDPLILPPVFNKATDSVGKDVWGRALQILRGCKNLIICGYSLPTTDIYMQYFLKAALGPNQDLNRIYVFDPDLYREDRRSQGEALRDRYARNFSMPIQRRIDFHPTGGSLRQDLRGTMVHLTWL